jgi:hypothetical protein
MMGRQVQRQRLPIPMAFERARWPQAIFAPIFSFDAPLLDLVPVMP